MTEHQCRCAPCQHSGERVSPCAPLTGRPHQRRALAPLPCRQPQLPLACVRSAGRTTAGLRSTFAPLDPRPRGTRRNGRGRQGTAEAVGQAFTHARQVTQSPDAPVGASPHFLGLLRHATARTRAVTNTPSRRFGRPARRIGSLRWRRNSATASTKSTRRGLLEVGLPARRVGQVGRGSLHRMQALHRLAASGFRIWPSDASGLPPARGRERGCLRGRSLDAGHGRLRRRTARPRHQPDYALAGKPWQPCAPVDLPRPNPNRAPSPARSRRRSPASSMRPQRAVTPPRRRPSRCSTGWTARPAPRRARGGTVLQHTAETTRIAAIVERSDSQYIVAVYFQRSDVRKSRGRIRKDGSNSLAVLWV